VILSVDLATCQNTLLVSVFWLQTDQPICANVNFWQNFLTQCSFDSSNRRYSCTRNETAGNLLKTEMSLELKSYARLYVCKFASREGRSIEVNGTRSSPASVRVWCTICQPARFWSAKCCFMHVNFCTHRSFLDQLLGILMFLNNMQDAFK